MSMSQQPSQPEVNTDNYESFLGLLQADEIIDSDTTFASEKDFQILHEARAMAWRDLPLRVIYRIQHVKKIRTPNGQDSIILYLYARNSTEPQIVWASSLLATELLAMKEIKNLYIKSCGLKKSLITGREYYNYQLVQKQ